MAGEIYLVVEVEIRAGVVASSVIQQQEPGVVAFYAGISQACVAYRTGCMASFARFGHIVVIVSVQTFALGYISVQKPLVVGSAVSALVSVTPSANLAAVVAGQAVLVGGGGVVLEKAHAEGTALVEEVGS